MNKQEVKEEIQSLIYEGDLEKVKVLINEFKNNFGSNDEIASMEAIIDFYEGDYNKALASIREGLKYNIFNSDLYYTMGNIYEESSQYNRAYLCYEQALYLCEKDENRNEIKKTIKNLIETQDVDVKNTSFVILTSNQLEHTKLCIDSIRKYNDKNTYEIIVVYNHSKDGTVEWLNKEDIKVIFNNDNKSFQDLYNQGINILNTENDIFLLNNDMVLMPNSRFNMRMGLYSSEKVGAIGSVSNNESYFKEANKTFKDFNEYLDYSISNNITDESRYEQRLKLAFLPMLIGRKAIEKVGIFNEKSISINNEEHDLNIKINLEGYRLFSCKDSYIHNLRSDSSKENIIAYNKLLNKEKSLVSIVVDAKEEEIYSIVDSILEQTYENIEIIIIKDNYNDYNTDNESIKYYKINKSITYNENIDRAIKKTRGKYFTVVEENVFLDSKKISKMMEYTTKEDIALVIDGIDTNEEVQNGRRFSNYIANNIIKLISIDTLGIINKDYYINQYAAYFNKKFVYLKDISTYCSCLKYGKVIGINNGVNVDNNLEVTLNKLFDSLVLIKELKEERIFASSEEYLKVISEIFNEIQNILGSDITKEVEEYINILKTNYEINSRGYNFYNLGFGTQIGGGEDIAHPEGIDIGNNTTIKEGATLMLPYSNLCEYPRISIGDKCDIGKRIVISATNKIVIEDSCILASNIHISDHNHEYRIIGIPIKEQGVSSFENEVVIGRGSWIANNCVIVGNVKIGRGCTIGANSVVISDIPDYCVAVGSPAKVIKYFDINVGEWIKVKEEGEFEKYQRELKDKKPLLTIGIPTYNRASYLERCLDNIYKEIGNDKLFEVLVVDNGSQDATAKVIKRYKSKYDNLTEVRRNETISANENISSIYKLAKGEFVNSHGDDDYYNPSIIYITTEILFGNKDISVLFTNPSASSLETYVGSGINEYINGVSYVSTLITGLIIKKSVVDEVFHKQIEDCCFNQVIYQFEALKDNGKFAILSGSIFTNDSGEHKPSGYNFGEFFIASYLELIEKYKKYGITDNTFSKEKENLLNNMIIPWIVKITNKDVDLSLENIIEIYSKYYKDESYYEEKLNIIKDLLLKLNY